MADQIKSPQNINAEISADGIVQESHVPPQGTQRQQQAPAPQTETKVDTEVKTNEGKIESGNEQQTQEQQAPPAEKEVDINDFLSLKENLDNTKKETPASKETAAKQLDTVPKTKEQQQEQQPNTGARDYSGIEEADVPLFKKMANESFNKLKPLYLDRKEKVDKLNRAEQRIAELEKGIVKIPDSYYEHPSAVLLTPEFGTASKNVQVAQRIQDHWNEQFKLVKEGAVEFNNLQFDANGNEVITKVPADAKAEAMILQAMSEANQFAITQKANLQAIVNTHRQKTSEAVGALNALEKQTFEAFDRPENEHLRKMVEATKQTLPVAFHSNPLVNGYAKALVAISQLFGIIQKLQGGAATNQQQNGGNGTQTAKPSDQRRAGPTAASAGGGAGAPSNGDVSFDDFERVKGGF